MHRIFAASLILAASGAVADPVAVHSGGSFPEGPLMVGDMLHWTEYGSGKVMRLAGEPEVLWEDTSCGPSGLIRFGGDLLVTCYDAGTVVRITLDGGTVETLGEGGAFVGANDLSSDGRGGAYLTASGPWESGPIVGKIYHISAEGIVREVADDLHYANGIALGPDDARLFVAESEAGRVISFAVGADGSLTDRRLFVRLADIDPPSGPNPYPDGMEFAADGTLWVGLYSGSRIIGVAPDGTLAGVIEVPSPAAPNLVFSADGKTLYVTAVDGFEAPYPGTVWRLPLE